MTNPIATTTFEQYAGTQARNYSRNPKHNVPILTDDRKCQDCDGSVTYDSDAGPLGWGGWVHTTDADHDARPATRCRYCGCQDPALVVFHQMPYSNETHCARCGGVDGFGIGD